MDFHLEHKPGNADIIRITAHCDRATLERWLQVHGMDTDRCPVPTTLTIEDGRLTYEQFVFDTDGKPIVESNDFKRETITVEQREPWPLDVGQADAG
jgi:hypothetical protein